MQNIFFYVFKDKTKKENNSYFIPTAIPTYYNT